MTPQAWIALIALMLATGSSVAGIAMYSSRTRSMAESAAHRARNVESAQTMEKAWNEQVYARKDVLDERFAAIQGSLNEIKDTLNAMRGGAGT